MNSLDLSSFIGEQPTNKSSSQFIENHKHTQQVFFDDLQTIDRISIDEDFWNPENTQIKYSNFEQPLIQEKTKNILGSIEEEDEEFNNSLSNQMANQTVQMAHNFLKNLALPLEEFKEKEKDENSRLSNRISFRSSKFNRMSHEFTREKIPNNHNKSENVERLSRLSVMASELESSNYFNFELKEVMITKENDFVEKNVLTLNLFDLTTIDKFRSMNFAKRLAPLQKLKTLSSKVEILRLISEMSFDILSYIEDEDILLEQFLNEIEFLKGKLVNYLELIKMSENYLKDNIDTQINYQQVLFKKNVWIINLKKMASNLLNINSLISRILRIQDHQEKTSIKLDNVNNFFSIFEDYKNLRQIFHTQALETFLNFFTINYEKKESAEKVRKILEVKLRNAGLYNLTKLLENFKNLLLPLDEVNNIRSMILPLFFEEIGNIVLLIEAYTYKYKKIFNIYQEFTLLVDEIFCFRKTHIKMLVIKLENFHEKNKVIYKNYTYQKAKEITMNDFDEIMSDFKHTKKKSKILFLKIQRSPFSRFPLIEYEYLVKDLKKAQGLIILGSDVLQLQEELQTKISLFNNFIKASENIKALQNDLDSLKIALNKYFIMLQEFNVLLNWLKTKQNQLNINELSFKVENAIELIKINIECVGKVFKNLQMNENCENLIHIEEHNSNLWIAKIHKLKKTGTFKDSSLAFLNNVMDNLEKITKKLEFFKKLAFLEKDLQKRTQTIIEHIEQTKLFLKKIISEKITNKKEITFNDDIQEIQKFIKKNREIIEKNDLKNVEETYDTCHKFIEYLGDIMKDEESIEKNEEKLIICNEAISNLNLLVQLIKEKTIFLNILNMLEAENLKKKLTEIFSKEKLALISKITIMNNELKNIVIQLKTIELVLLKQDYNEISNFLEDLIKILAKLEDELEKITAISDPKLNQSKILEIQQYITKGIENLHVVDKEKRIPKKYYENIINLFFKELLPPITDHIREM